MHSVLVIFCLFELYIIIRIMIVFCVSIYSTCMDSVDSYVFTIKLRLLGRVYLLCGYMHALQTGHEQYIIV